MRFTANSTLRASDALRNPESERKVGREPSRMRFTVTEKLSPGRFAALSRAYAESSRETVWLPIGPHIYIRLYVNCRRPSRALAHSTRQDPSKAGARSAPPGFLAKAFSFVPQVVLARRTPGTSRGRADGHVPVPAPPDDATRSSHCR
jgi:hypothetical protein